MNEYCPDWYNCQHEPRHKPLPPQGRDALNRGPYPDWDDALDAPTPEPARLQMERP